MLVDRFELAPDRSPEFAVRDLARGILEKEVSPERVHGVEQGDDWYDARLWQTLKNYLRLWPFPY